MYTVPRVWQEYLGVMAALLAALRAEVLLKANPSKAKQQGSYFKNVLPFHGLTSPVTNDVFKAFMAGHAAEIDGNTLLALSESCIAEEYFEFKSLGILMVFSNPLLMWNTAKGPGTAAVTSAMERCIDGGHVFDWATADGVAGRVLAQCVRRDPSGAVADRIAAWSGAHHNPWKQRVGAVTFVKLADPSMGHRQRILGIASVLCGVNHRFVQLGCGWMLRELAVHDEGAVTDLLKSQAARGAISREGLRYATEKMNPRLQRELQEYHATRGPAKGWGSAVGRQAGGPPVEGAAVSSSGGTHSTGVASASAPASSSAGERPSKRRKA